MWTILKSGFQTILSFELQPAHLTASLAPPVYLKGPANSACPKGNEAIPPTSPTPKTSLVFLCSLSVKGISLYPVVQARNCAEPLPLHPLHPKAGGLSSKIALANIHFLSVSSIITMVNLHSSAAQWLWPSEPPSDLFSTCSPEISDLQCTVPAMASPS